MTATPLYAGLLVALYLFLTFRIILYRRRELVDMGDGGKMLLRRYVRAHANFAEYAPLGLLLLALLELGVWPFWLVHLLGLLLLAGRLAHAWAFSVEALRGPPRAVGMVLTIAMLAIAGLLCLLRGLHLA